MIKKRKKAINSKETKNASQLPSVPDLIKIFIGVLPLGQVHGCNAYLQSENIKNYFLTKLLRVKPGSRILEYRPTLLLSLGYFRVTPILER